MTFTAVAGRRSQAPLLSTRAPPNSAQPAASNALTALGSVSRCLRCPAPAPVLCCKCTATPATSVASSQRAQGRRAFAGDPWSRRTRICGLARSKQHHGRACISGLRTLTFISRPSRRSGAA